MHRLKHRFSGLNTSSMRLPYKFHIKEEIIIWLLTRGVATCVVDTGSSPSNNGVTLVSVPLVCT